MTKSLSAADTALQAPWDIITEAWASDSGQRKGSSPVPVPAPVAAAAAAAALPLASRKADGKILTTPQPSKQSARNRGHHL
mmetsp:Transcript_47015/g.100651  ORF Transcript_47015/g.100651 Transcript_47015/m.100651 type:complete len:81 (-) Transcript_47015:54-296(-)